MLSKSVFKQTLRQNWKLWLIFTVVAAGIAAAIINTFDPHAMRLAMQAFGPDGPGAGMGGGPLGTGTSRFGMLTIPDLMASGYYAMLGLIMPLVYVIITANTLIALQIDRGSMAYTLSTPVTRLQVVFTQAVYLIVALLAMFSAVTGVGLLTSQLSHNALWGQQHIADVLATAPLLGEAPQVVSDNHMQGVETDTLMVGLEAAADYLGTDTTQLMTQLNLLENNPEALAVASQASGLSEATLMAFIQVQQAEAEYAFDQGIYFNLTHFVMLNVGIFLLMFAIGGISFLFSCVFNLSRNSLALGAGIPLAFFMLDFMSSMRPNFANLRFLTLNTLQPHGCCAGQRIRPTVCSHGAHRYVTLHHRRGGFPKERFAPVGNLTNSCIACLLYGTM